MVGFHPLRVVRPRGVHWLVACALMLGYGCGDPGAEDINPNAVANGETQPMAVGTLEGNTGKADGDSFAIKDFFKHTRNLPVNDLVDRTATLGTDLINVALSKAPFVSLKLSDTQLFGLEQGSESGSNIASLQNLVNGLLARYGDSDFVTQINNIRVQHLQNSPDKYFAETEFRVGGRTNLNFSVPAGDTDVNLGFDPGIELSVRAVFAYPDNVDAILNQPLKIFAEARGFVLPRDIDDLRGMLPGESIQLSGTGLLGYNFGANLPIFSVSPVDHLVLTSRFHLGARVQTRGELDIQVIRGGGSDLFIDVGMANIKEREFKAAFQSGWGLEGIPPILEVAVGSKVYSLGQIADEYLEKRIARSGLLSYGAEAVRERANERRSIQRFKVDLNVSSVEVDAAVKQAIGGDLRLIQTLADRQTAGIYELASLERALQQQRRKLGAHFASMRFYSENIEQEGTVVVSANGTTDEILFQALEQNRGSFWKDLGFKRLMLTSQSWQNGEYVGAKSNLRLTVTESDKFTERDQILDHVDAALLGVMDFDTAYVQLTRDFEELQHEVDMHCDECNSNEGFSCKRRYEQCIDELITEAQIDEWSARLNGKSVEVINRLTSQGYHKGFAQADTIASALLGLKLELSSVKEARVALADVTGDTYMMSDVRMTQEGINDMFRATPPEVFRERLEHILTMIVSKRSKEYDKKYNKATRWLDRERGKIDDMISVYARARDQYMRMDDASRIGVAGLTLSDGGVVLTNAGDDDRPIADSMSLAEQKGQIVGDMVDELIERGRELNLIQALIRLVSLGLINPRAFESHHLVAYTMATLIKPQYREWLISMDFENDGFSDVRFYSRGEAEDGLIAPGEFDLDSLLAR